MNQNPKLIIVTLMLPKGETGVQTHFNAILGEAAKCGIDAELITPHNHELFVVRKAAGLIGKLLGLLKKEWRVFWFRLVHYALLAYQLKRLLKHQKHKVVIYTQDPLSTKAALPAKKAGHRIVTVVHFNVSEADEMLAKGLTVENGLLHRHLRSIEMQALPCVDKIIFVSRFMQKIVNDRLRPLASVPQAVIGNFVHDCAEERINTNLHADIITVGTLETRKNQSFILRVIANAHQRGYRYRLTVVGDGPDRAKLEQLAAKLGIEESVNFLGFKPNASEYMPGHRLYAQASLMESFGITLIEAMSNSLPVLVSAVGGIPEVLVDGEQGYFWPLDDLDAATDRLCDILENEDLRSQMAIRARTRFEESFSEKRLAHKWIEELMSA